MSIKLEEGRYYKTRDGRRVGPMVRNERQDGYIYRFEGPRVDPAYVNDWKEDGIYLEYVKSHSCDIISEWPSSPQEEHPAIRTITRREIVPGVYGRVRISDAVAPNAISLNGNCYFSPTELREAATLFNLLADVLEENETP